MASAKANGHHATQQPATIIMASAKANGHHATQQPATQSQRVSIDNNHPGGGPGELARQDPFELLARDPFQLLLRDRFQLLRDMVFQLFQTGRHTGRALTWNPSFEIRETDDAFVFKADMPGVRNEDLEISLLGNQLQITRRREKEYQQDDCSCRCHARERSGHHSHERSHGRSSHAFALPGSADVDNIRAELNNGVLTLSVPKRPCSAPPRRTIEIGSGSRSFADVPS